MQDDTTSWLPLFPLKAVLFPGGILPLRIFEARYVDMVSECMRNHTPFGVVLIRSGEEVGEAALPEAVGTLAHITDWDMQAVGVMGIRVVGGERFRITDTRVGSNQRLEAKYETIAPDSESAVDEQVLACATALRTVIDDFENRGHDAEGEKFLSPFARPFQLANASWVANRWCEILPISLAARQKLLELEDGQSRLNVVHRYLVQHKILHAA